MPPLVAHGTQARPQGVHRTCEHLCALLRPHLPDKGSKMIERVEVRAPRVLSRLCRTTAGNTLYAVFVCRLPLSRSLPAASLPMLTGVYWLRACVGADQCCWLQICTMLERYEQQVDEI